MCDWENFGRLVAVGVRYYMDSLEFTSGSSSNDGGIEGCLVVPIRLKAPVFVRNLMRARMPSLVPRMV